MYYSKEFNATKELEIHTKYHEILSKIQNTPKKEYITDALFFEMNEFNHENHCDAFTCARCINCALESKDYKHFCMNTSDKEINTVDSDFICKSWDTNNQEYGKMYSLESWKEKVKSNA